jgi:hypothetical protein
MHVFDFASSFSRIVVDVQGMVQQPVHGLLRASMVTPAKAQRTADLVGPIAEP